MPHADRAPGTPPSSASEMNPARQRIEELGLTPRSRAKVAIAEREGISPMMLANAKEVDDFTLDRSPKQFSANVARRLSGRSIRGLSSPTSFANLRSPFPIRKEQTENENLDQEDEGHHALSELFLQIVAWLHDEKQKLGERRGHGPSALKLSGEDEVYHAALKRVTAPISTAVERTPSRDSEHFWDLQKLEHIVEKGMKMVMKERPGSRRATLMRRPSLKRLSQRPASFRSSDNDHSDLNELVPSCDAILDNSKTVSCGEIGASEASMSSLGRIQTTERDAWRSFKYEILRLTHTLRLKRWRLVPRERSREITVERLSGALTNAVYVVSPPKDIASETECEQDDSKTPTLRKPPPKLLLRIYGPQAEHLIDRQMELQVLGRLCRKNIGPRLLGTFKNGRFEEYLNARALKPQDLREPQTSRQIAKRMRELHQGIDLREQERDDGPFVWKNWDKWIERCEQVVAFVDNVPESERARRGWQGPVCGLQWSIFRRTVERYRKWLDEQYGGSERLKDFLVFAHNDTQYGNILRLVPAGESPLFLPANQHKQLVVIDFEYANANPPGLEFANHFTEWCYNYHDPEHPHQCETTYYPTPDEQRRFLQAYLQHRPHFPPASSSYSCTDTPILSAQSVSGPDPLDSAPATPAFLPINMTSSASSLRSFNLDGRVQCTREEEEAEVEKMEQEVTQLMQETRAWRVACSAQWVLWGILQAHVDGMEPQRVGSKAASEVSAESMDEVAAAETQAHKVEEAANDGANFSEAEAQAEADEQKEEAAEKEADSFDYLAYSHDRALFFWGDVLQLPEEVLRNELDLAVEPGGVKEDGGPTDVVVIGEELMKIVKRVVF